MTDAVMLAFADIHPNKPPEAPLFKKKRDFLHARGCSVKENTHFFPGAIGVLMSISVAYSALSFDQVTLTRRYILMKNLIVERML
jgi:hypothetical protein